MTRNNVYEISTIFFYVSFIIEALALVLLFSNNYLHLGEIVAYIMIILVINAPILIGISIYRIIKKEYLLPILAIAISSIAIALFIGLLYALSQFT